jgi:hypothetical protein
MKKEIENELKQKFEEKLSMYEGVIKESNTLLKLYNSMLTYLNPDKKELKKISQRILEVVSVKDYAQQQMELLKKII